MFEEVCNPVEVLMIKVVLILVLMYEAVFGNIQEVVEKSDYQEAVFEGSLQEANLKVCLLKVV